MLKREVILLVACDARVQKEHKRGGIDGCMLLHSLSMCALSDMELSL